MEKPTCRKCAGQHWPFVRCQDAEQRNTAEADAAAERVRAMEAAKVVPMRRHPPKPFSDDRLRTFKQVAPGVFVRVRQPEPPEAA